MAPANVSGRVQSGRAEQRGGPAVGQGRGCCKKRTSPGVPQQAIGQHANRCINNRQGISRHAACAVVVHEMVCGGRGCGAAYGCLCVAAVQGGCARHAVPGHVHGRMGHSGLCRLRGCMRSPKLQSCGQHKQAAHHHLMQERTTRHLLNIPPGGIYGKKNGCGPNPTTPCA